MRCHVLMGGSQVKLRHRSGAEAGRGLGSYSRGSLLPLRSDSTGPDFDRDSPLRQLCVIPDRQVVPDYKHSIGAGAVEARSWQRSARTRCIVTLISYWRNDEHPELPDPAGYVDNTWG